MALYEKLTATSSPEEIAAAYKEFTGLVGGDTQEAQTRAVDYLSGLGIAAPTITQAYQQYLAPAPAPAAAPALTVNQLYQQYAGREADPDGLAYWAKDFGDTIDSREIEVFKQAVAEARAQGTEPAAQTLPSYFQQNPDVAAAYQQNSYGMTPDQFAQTHFDKFGVNEQRAAPTSSALSQVIAQIPAITFTPGLADQTMEQKATEYRNLLGQGFTDAQIRSAADAAFGTQSNSDWNALTSAAAFNTDYSALGDLVGAAGVGGDQAANAARLAASNKPFQELYADYLGPGRTAEQEGLDYWRNRFGPTIDDEEREIFRQAAAAELTKNFGEGDAGLLAGFKYAKDLGVSDEGLRKTLGDDLFNKYNTDLTNFAVTNLTNIIADDQLTWEESQRIHNFGRDLGFTPDDLARMTGQNKSLFELAESNYLKGRDQIINNTLADPSVTSDADRVLAALALQDQFKFTDEDLAQATGYDVDLLKSSLDPVRNFTTTFGSVVNSPDTSTSQLKTLIADSRNNAAINKMYGDSLNQIETKINGLEQKWGSHQGVDPLQAENLFNQLEAQKNAIGGQYYSGVFGDTMNMAAALNRKGLETIGDLGQKDKFATEASYKTFTGPNGQPVQQDENGNFFSFDTEGNFTRISPDQVNTTFNKIVYDDPEGGGRYVPLSAEEIATLKDDGTYQTKIGTVVIDKDTGQELTGTDGVLVTQRSGGKLTGKKHHVNVQFTSEGVPVLTANQEKTGFYDFVSTAVPMALTVASFIPGPHQPFARLANAALALEQKNYLGAVLSGLSAYGQYTGNELATLRAAEASGDIVDAGRMIDLQNTLSNVKLASTFAQGAAALQAENIPALINAGLSAYGQLSDTPLPSGVTTAVQLGNLGIAIENKQLDQVLNALGDLTGSKDIRIAGAAKTLVDEFKKAGDSGDYSGVINAGLGLADVVKSAPTTKADQGGITNRVYDDTIVQAGADAFIRAKEAGASDEDAMAAANSASGVVINKIPDAGPSNVVTTNYLPAEETKNERTRLANEYASSLGKTIGTLTAEEVDNFVDKIDSAITSKGSAVLKGASIQDILSGNYAALPTDEKGFFYDERGVPRVEIIGGTKVDEQGNPIIESTTSPGSQVAKNVADAIVESVGGLEGTTGKIVQQGLSTLLGGIGEQVADISTSFGNMGLISRDNAGVTAGKYLEDIGKRLQLPETKQALSNWVTAVDKEPTYFGKIAAGVKGAFQNPLVLTEVVKEIGQEILPGAIGLKIAKYAGLGAGVASSTFLNAIESAGSTGRQSYDEEIAKGTPPAEAARIADRKAGYAGIITMATSGITDAAIAKKYGAAIEDFLGKKASSTGGEFVQEGLEEGLIALATGKTPAEALTQSVVGSLVGSKTSGTIQTAADVQADLAASFASQGLASTDGTFRAETIVPIGTSGETVVGPVLTDGDKSVSIDSGADLGGVPSDVSLATPPSVSIEDAQSVMADLGLNVSDDVAVSLASKISGAADSGVLADQSIASFVSDAIAAGADTNTAISAATQAAINSGNNVAITSDAGVTTISNATTNTTTSVNSNTNTTTTVDANTNINTQTNVNGNITTNTTVDNNTKTTTQTTTDANTNVQTTVVTDTDTNTQITVKVNTDTGEVVEEKETEIPVDWKPPVIEISPPTVTTTPPVTTPKINLQPQAGQRTAGGVMGPPTGMNLSPASLRSQVTEGRIDPLARVKEAQAELERSVMTPTMDPRIAQMLQQQANPQQQAQQFDKDIGALAKLLSGKTDAPVSNNPYYSYGSEDSIDDILGGMRAYKEGGYVAPLMAEGGMALPLLAKSGGALGHYKGREDFKGGKHVAGEGDGQSDDIPAWLADGEFVFPADVVSALGNGSSKAGTDKLYEMMHNIRDRARSKRPKDLPPPAFKSPLDYLKSSKRSAK